MKEAFIKLLKVKSIVTLMLTVVFSILSLRGDIKPDLFIPIFTTIIAFYYGVQTEKKGE